jgi:hypothetical protein
MRESSGQNGMLIKKLIIDLELTESLIGTKIEAVKATSLIVLLDGHVMHVV